MTWSATDLPWLPPAPPDFRRRCDAAESADGECLAMLQRLANHALDLNQLTRLAKSVDRMAEAGRLGGLTAFTLGILSNGTTSLLVPALVASALRYGIALRVVEAPYDQAAQWALDPGSALNTAKPDAVLLAFDHRILALPADPVDPAAGQGRLNQALAYVESLRRGLKAGCGAPAIVQTVPAPLVRYLGSYDARLPGSGRALAERFNVALLDSLRGGSDVLLDVAGLAQSVGLENWHNEPQWFMAKLPCAQSMVPLYAEHVARLVGAMRGKSRKCLVFDLDNTMWSGVIGDDGIDGIVIGQGNATGEAFLDLQQCALTLRRLGVVLAVASKNDDEIARQPFRDHPDMALRESDIAVFQANWSDKASNLEAIAKALDIGVDTLVFLDDNPVERAQVREALPMVAVPELPDDPALYLRTLLAAGYFEAVSFSDEDRTRADQYRANAQRQELAGQVRDLGEFLQSLKMVISFAPFDEQGRARIAQLINKSNQFNLTTRRYTEANIASLAQDPTVFTLQVRLSDMFGDNGMIGAIICRVQDAAWEVDTWVMSCRVLGRRVEEAVLRRIAVQAKAGGAKKLIGTYIPTPRNGLVKDHYEKLGFTKLQESAGTVEWQLDLDSYVAPQLPMNEVEAPYIQAA